MKTAAHQARLAGDKNRAKLKADVGLVARGAVEEVLNKLACESCPQSCACRRALVQGRRERVQIFKHERAPITRPSMRHSFTLVSHARPHTVAGH